MKCPGSISTTYSFLRDTSPWYRINKSVLLTKNNTCINSWYVAGLDLMSRSTKREKLHYIVKLTVIWTQDVCSRGKNLSKRTIDCLKRYILDSAIYLNNGQSIISNYCFLNLLNFMFFLDISNSGYENE